MTDYNNELNLFQQEDDYGNVFVNEELEVVKSEFIKKESVTWNELFNGFDELYAITFSSGIEFTSKVLNYFEYAEIIYGCEGIINQKLATIISMQSKIIEEISKSKAINTITQKINDNLLKLYVSKDTKSHEKIYILKANDGKTRVITGSANLSKSAFEGFQRENIIYFDDLKAFEYYFERFNNYKLKCSNNISEELIGKVINDKEYLQDNIESIPILEETNKLVYITINQDVEGDVDIVTDIKGFEDEIKPMLPRKAESSKLIKLSSDDLKNITRTNRVKREEKKRDRQIAQLHLDYDNDKLYFNKEELNLNPDKEKIKSDITSLIDFLDGFKHFNGDYKDAQNQYYAYMNWFFSSIFMPELRYIASNKGYSLNYFPIFGMLCGPSNAGKTTFVSMLSKLMSGKRIRPTQNESFSTREINKLRCTIEGVPIMIEDLAKSQYDNNYEKIIKDDEFGISEHFQNYPSVSITANKISSLTQDITKRVVYFRNDISTDKETGTKNAKAVNDSIKKATNSLYCEYIRRMLPIVHEMKDKMNTEEKDFAPDILKASSIVLKEIINENLNEIPHYVRKLDFNDYFGDKVIGKTAIDKIVKAWYNQKDQFVINKKENTLIYNVPDNSSYEIGYLVNELPPKLNAKKYGGSLIMDLDTAKEFFEINFKKGLFG